MPTRPGTGARPGRRTTTLVLLGALLLAALISALHPGGALAAPGVPAAPRTVYTEDFENGVGTTPVLLTDYVGATGQTYTADAPWLTACNGVVLPFAAPDSDQAAAGCASATSYDHVRQISYALAGNTANHAVSAYTENPPPGADNVQFETATPIALATSNRFITFSVDAAETNCFANHALFKFYLVNGASEIPTFTTPIDPCVNAGTRTVTAPAVGAIAAQDYQTGTFAGNRAVLFSGAAFGIRMRNGQASSAGNDAGFDNIRVLDATPQLDKSFSRTDLNVGEVSRLTFTITNTSELGAKQGWSFKDNLANGLRVANPASASTTCTNGAVTAPAGGGSVAVTGDLDQGQASCTVSVDVTASTAGTYTNGPSNFDPLVGLDPPPPTTITFRAADLSIVKSATPTVAVPGTEQSYQLVVKNNGPDTANNVRVADALPTGLTFVSASPECSAVGATVACTVPSLGVGESRTFTVKAKVAASLNNRLDNTATVVSDTPDPDPSNNTSTVPVPLKGRADLSITKKASLSTVAPGGQVLYTLVVKNDGPSDATGVTVTDAPPAGLTLQSAKGGTGTTCTIPGGAVRCELGTIPAGGTAQILVTAQTAATAAGALTNRATVIGNEDDPDPKDNTTTSTVTVPTPPPPAQPVADLGITKKVNHKAVRLGGALTYTLVVTNKGPSAATDVVITDTPGVPAKSVSIKPSAGKCSGSVPFTCALGTVQPGQKVTITVKLTPTVVGAVRNTASVTFPGTDPNTGDNISGVSAKVTKPTLGLSKSANHRTITAGRTVTYTLRVSNPSSGTVRDVKVCDNLPSGLVYVSSKSRAKLTKGQYCWTVKSLGARKSKTFTLTARALRGTSGTKTNRATASSPSANTKRASRSVRVRRTALRAGGVTG